MVAPRSRITARAQKSFRPIRMLPAGVLLGPEPGVHVGPVVGGQPVLDAGQRRRPVAGPHLLDPDHQHRAARSTARAEVPRCSAEAPPAHELSTLTTGTSPRPALRSHVWPRMQPWSQSRPPRALATTTSESRCGSTPASASASCTDLVGHGLGGQVPPAHVGHPRPQDGHRFAAARVVRGPGPGPVSPQGARHGAVSCAHRTTSARSGRVLPDAPRAGPRSARRPARRSERGRGRPPAAVGRRAGRPAAGVPPTAR